MTTRGTIYDPLSDEEKLRRIVATFADVDCDRCGVRMLTPPRHSQALIFCPECAGRMLRDLRVRDLLVRS
jgi:DNA-directed RNA polymerase subunit RPC12/RpoP